MTFTGCWREPEDRQEVVGRMSRQHTESDGHAASRGRETPQRR